MGECRDGVCRIEETRQRQANFYSKKVASRSHSLMKTLAPSAGEKPAEKQRHRVWEEKNILPVIVYAS